MSLAEAQELHWPSKFCNWVLFGEVLKVCLLWFAVDLSIAVYSWSIVVLVINKHSLVLCKSRTSVYLSLVLSPSLAPI